MRQILFSFGILVIYAVSSIFLEQLVVLSDPLQKTVLSFLYFFVWISPLLYLWWKARIQDKLVIPILVLFLAILYISPLATIPVPVGKNFPDVDFHAAKVLYCSTGHFFNDPVTSYPTIYPPVYHIIIGSIMRLLGSHDSWYMLSQFHIGMLIVLFLSIYFLAHSMFNPRVGFLSVWFLGAIFDMPNWSGMFFPTPFLLGLTLMVNSITLVYLALQGRRWCFYLGGLVSGLAVTIWPAFLPVAVAMVVIISFIAERKFRIGILSRFIPSSLALPFMVWIPQYILLSGQNLMGNESIGLWKGIPKPSWFFDLIIRFITLGGFDRQQQWVTVLFGITYALFIGFALLGFRALDRRDLVKKRFLGLFSVSMLLVIPMIHYVFSFMYSRRVQLPFNILVVIVAAYYFLIQSNKKYRIWVVVFILWAAGFANGWNIHRAHQYVADTKESYETWQKHATGALRFIESHTNSGDYIFATANTYRFVVIGNILRFTLVAHRSGSYYSLNPDLARELYDHYNDILMSNDLGFIKRVLGYYGIRYVLIREGEQTVYPGLGQLYDKCTVGYRDVNYSVLKCDAVP